MAHLLGPPPSGVECAFAGAYAAIFAAFAAGKYGQSIKDDIGDKSIFECAARPWTLLSDPLALASMQLLYAKMLH